MNPKKEDGHWLSSFSKNPKRGGSSLPLWMRIAIPFIFLPLSVVAILFAISAQENRQSAAVWESLAQERKKESLSLQKSLLASEADVRRLEDRQRNLSREKASAEDETTLLLRLSSDLIDAGKLQQSCSSRLARLAEQIASKRWSWVERETEDIFSSCNQANLRFQTIATSLENKKEK